MQQFNVNEGNVQWVVRNVTQSLGDGRFSLGEILLGLTESLGRVVVSSCPTPVQGMQMVDVIQDHLRTTLKAGYSSKGFNTGEH